MNFFLITGNVNLYHRLLHKDTIIRYEDVDPSIVEDLSRRVFKPISDEKAKALIESGEGTLFLFKHSEGYGEVPVAAGPEQGASAVETFGEDTADEPQDPIADLLDNNISDVSHLLADVNDILLLGEIRDAEVEGQDRKGVLKAIDERMGKVDVPQITHSDPTPITEDEGSHVIGVTEVQE